MLAVISHNHRSESPDGLVPSLPDLQNSANRVLTTSSGTLYPDKYTLHSLSSIGDAPGQDIPLYFIYFISEGPPGSLSLCFLGTSPCLWRPGPSQAGAVPSGINWTEYASTFCPSC